MQFVPAQLLPLGGMALAIALAIYCWGRRDSLPARLFLAVTGIIILWSIGVFVFMGATMPMVKQSGAAIIVACVSAATGALMLFTLAYSGRERLIGPWLVAPLTAFPVAVFVIALLNSVFGIYWSVVELRPTAYGTLEFNGTRGLMSLINSVYVTALLVTTTLLIGHLAIKWRHREQSTVIPFVFGITVPWFALASTLNPYFTEWTVSTLYIAIMVTMGSFGYALVRSGMLDLTPLAQSLVINGLSDGFIIINARRRIVDANASAARLLKREPTSLRGLAIDTIAPDVPPLGVTTAGELGPDRLGDGQTFLVSFATLSSPRGEALGAVIQIRDVTDQRRHETELREANERKDAVIAATPDHLFRVRDDGMVLGYFPPGGVTPDDVYLPKVGVAMRDRAPASQVEPIMEAIARARRTGQVQVIEGPTTRPSGGEAILETRVSPMPGDECLLFVRDVTEMRRREHAVREAQNKTQAMIAALPDYVIYIKHDGTVLNAFAPGGSVDTDIHLLPAVGDNIFQNAPQLYRATFERAVQDARGTGRVQIFEVQLQRPSGALAHIETRVSPMSDDECLLLIRDVTAKREQEQALIVATARTKAILAAVPDHIFRVTDDGVVLEHYPPIGYRGPMAVMTPVGDSYRNYLPPAWSKLLDITVRKARATGELQTLEVALPRRDGGRVYLEIRIVPMTGSEVLLFARNVTEKRQREQELREAKEKTQAIISAMPDHIFQIRADGVVLAHYPPPDAGVYTSMMTPVGDSFVNHVPADWSQQFFNAMRAARQTGAMQVIEVTARASDLGAAYLEARVTAMPNNEFLFFVRNVTEKRRREQELREAKDKTQAIIAAIPDYIFHVRNDGALLDAFTPNTLNPGEESLAPAHGSLQTYLASDHVERLLAAMAKASETGELQVIEGTTTNRAGAYVTLETRIVPMANNESLLLVRNVTERKRVERLKDEFVSTVSHELRTPLTSIRGALGLLSGGVGGQLPPSALPLVDIANRSLDRLINLINDLLDIQKIESGKMVFNFETICLQDIVLETMEANSAYAAQYGVRLSYADTTDTLTVRVDPERLTQVLTNLLSNAAKFAPRDSVVEVAVTRGDNGWARVSVTDTGPGIPPEFRERIFQKFQQADGSSTREKGGTGLGLSIAKAMVERMGGSISFTSEPHVATVFWVDLPVVAEASATDSKTESVFEVRAA